MKKILKGFVIFIGIIAIVFYWPKSLNTILDIDYEKVDKIIVNLVEPGFELIEDDYGNEVGVPDTKVYQLEMDCKDQKTSEILSILNQTKYHSKIRNLLPVELEVSNQDFEYSGYVYFSIDEDYRWVYLLGDERIAISSKKDLTNIYTMTDSKVLDEFVKFMKNNGTLIEEK